mmetsp:Transcript_2054/g.4843  ORF Transcript_2054/g.4843 Transcript_2054/m.4843 type:complete len:81 (+) Transcript_2054:195-437(+)
MHPLVRDLYKRVITVGKDYPGGMELVRRKAKAWFRENTEISGELEIRRAVARGRWYVKNELTAVIQLKKYRTIKARYTPP